LTEIDRGRIFDHVDESHKGTVQVKDFLKTIEGYEFQGQEQSQDLQKVRDYLQLQIQRSREKEEEAVVDSTSSRTGNMSEFELLKQSKGIANETERMRIALGMRTYNLDFHPEELEDVLQENFHKPPTSESHRKYARFLHHSNLKLGNIPFYEMRSTELDRLKEKAVKVHQALDSDAVMGRFTELAKKRWLPSSTTVNADIINSPTRRFADDDSLNNSMESVSDTEGELPEKVMMLSKSLPNLTIRPSPLAKPTASITGALQSPQQTLNPHTNQGHAVRLDSIMKHHEPLPSDSSPAASPIRNTLDMPKYSSSPVKQSQSKSKLPGSVTSGGGGGGGGGSMFGDGLEEDLGSVVATMAGSDDASALLSSMPQSLNGAKSVANLVASLNASKRTKPVSKLRTGLLDQEEKKIQPSDFFTQIIDESSSMGRLKDPSAVFRIEKIDPNVYQPSCRKTIQQGPTDWSRVGIGGERAPNEGYGGTDNEDFYRTTNSSLYPPLIYEPSQPVSRQLISDADMISHKKEYIRQQRHARKSANMEVTKTRIEYEALEKEIRALRRQHSRVEDNIRYKSNVFLDDLQSYRALPLQRMSKRQNMELSDRMWNGSMEKQTVQLVTDSRDFASTYSSSFDGQVIRDTIRITAQAINEKLHASASQTSLATPSVPHT
jgi:hypothetical protein